MKETKKLRKTFPEQNFSDFYLPQARISFQSRCSRITFRRHEITSQVAFPKAPKWRRNIYIHTHADI